MKKIPLTKGFFALVDDDDFEMLNQHRWCYAHGRAVRGIHLGGKKTTTIFMHRVLCETGPRLQVQHKDGNYLNNQRSNLAAVSGGTLRRKDTTKNRTGFRGVHKMYNRYMAKISVGGVTIYLGTYETALDAARAYDRALLKYAGSGVTPNVRNDDEHHREMYLKELQGNLDERISDRSPEPQDQQPPHRGDGGEGVGQNNL